MAKRSPKVRKTYDNARHQEGLTTRLQRTARNASFFVHPGIPVVTMLTELVLTKSRHKVPLKAITGLLVAGAVVFVSVGWKLLFLAHLELAPALQTFLAAEDSDFGPVRDLVQERKTAWLVQPLVTVVPLGLGLGAVAAMWRARRQADWRTDDNKPPAPLTRRQQVKARSKAETAMVKQVQKDRKKATAWQDTKPVVGFDAEGKPARLPGAVWKDHMLVTGPTGVGKTTTLTRLARVPLVEWQSAGWAQIFFDFKASPDVVADLTAMAEATGRKLFVVSVDGTQTINPLATGTPLQIASRIMATLEAAADGGFSEPHYRVAGERLLITSAVAMCDLADRKVLKKSGAPWRRSLDDLAMLLNPADLFGVEPLLLGNAKERVHILGSWSERELDDAAGVAARIKLWTETQAGPVCRWSATGVDIKSIIDDGDMLLLSLDGDGSKAAASQIGNLVLGQLLGLASEMTQQRWPDGRDARVQVILDEFGVLGGEMLTAFFERSRSAGMSVIVSTQTDGTLKLVSDSFHETVLANAATWVMHRQPIDAEDRAGFLGTVDSWAETLQVQEDSGVIGDVAQGTGVGSLRAVQSFKISPNELRSLGVGQVIIANGGREILERVTVVPWPEDVDVDATELPTDVPVKKPVIALPVTSLPSEDVTDSVDVVTLPQDAPQVPAPEVKPPADAPEPAPEPFGSSEEWGFAPDEVEAP